MIIQNKLNMLQSWFLDLFLMSLSLASELEFVTDQFS